MMTEVGVVALNTHEALKHIRWKCSHARSVEIRGKDVLVNGCRHFVVTGVQCLRGRKQYRLEFIGQFHERTDLEMIRNEYWAATKTGRRWA